MIKISFLASTTAVITHSSYYLLLITQRSAFTTSFLLPSILRTSTSITSMSSSSSSLSSLLNEITGKNLLPLKKCIELSNAQQHESSKDHANNKAIFIDSSWCPTWKSKGRNGRIEFENGGERIPDSIFFDLDDIARKGGDLGDRLLPHMMPSKELFAAAMDASGISNSNHVVIYGKHGSKTGPRTWYTFRCMGHDMDKVHVMQGSLEEWTELGGSVDASLTKVIVSSDLDLATPASYEACDAQNIIKKDQILFVVNNPNDSNSIIVDARSNARFIGEAPEPRPVVHAGHIPNSINIPFTKLLVDPTEGITFKPVEGLKTEFESAGIIGMMKRADEKDNTKIICSCGSGVTACYIALALEECGSGENTFLYDGSWAEYGDDPSVPIEK